MNRSSATVPARQGALYATLAALAPLAALAVVAAFAPSSATGATRIFTTNHVNSNDVRGLAAWDGRLAAATTGGVVLADMPSGPFTKVLRSTAGLPSNQTLCATASPAGRLWIGTAGLGLARLQPNGSFARTLTTFDGLPSSQVQALFRTGDSVWVGTFGGVALFTENPTSGQVALRRSDSNASTAGGLISDDVRALASLRDTVWCATGAGLSAFAAGAWIPRGDLLATAANALLAFRDTLWVGTTAGPRAYVNGVLEPVAAGHFGQCLSLAEHAGTVFSATGGSGVYRHTGGAWSATGPGLPLGKTNTLAVAPDGALWVGAETGLARYDSGSNTWTAFQSEGPLVDAIERAVADARGAWFVTGNVSAQGTGGGMALRFDGANWSAVTSVSTGGDLQAAATFGLLSDRNGRLWFGHCCAGGPDPPRTDRWDPGTDTWDQPQASNLWAFGLGPPGRVYGVSVEHGNGVYVFDEASAALLDSLTPDNTAGGLSQNDLRAVAFDPSGRGWFGTQASGLDRWDNRGTDTHADDIWAHFATGFPSLQTTSIAVLSDSYVYVGTTGGIVALQNGLVDLSRKDAINAVLGGSGVTSLSRDPRGIVWIGSASGIVRLDHATGALERFTTADGLVNDDVRALAWDEARGVLWVGTSRGISQVRPSEEGASAFDDGAFVFPNPLGPSSGPLRIGGLTGEATGEVRDVAGALVRRFRVNPAADVAWDLRGVGGEPAASGIYLIVLRDGARTRILRAAVAR